MKMFEKYKLFKFFIIVFLLYIVSVSFFDIHLGYRRHLKRLEMITHDLINFIHKNDGHFPENKQEFAPYVSSIGLLDSFQIQYGIQLTELYEKHGKLYDRKGEHVLLIKGNTKIPFIQKNYERCSLDIFRANGEK